MTKETRVFRKMRMLVERNISTDREMVGKGVIDGNFKLHSRSRNGEECQECRACITSTYPLL